MIGLEARWRHHSGQAANRSRLELGRATLDTLLAHDRRQGIVLCHAARILLYTAVSAAEATDEVNPDHGERAGELYTECLAANASLRPRFEDEIDLLSRHRESLADRSAAAEIASR